MRQSCTAVTAIEATTKKTSSAAGANSHIQLPPGQSREYSLLSQAPQREPATALRASAFIRNRPPLRSGPRHWGVQVRAKSCRGHEVDRKQPLQTICNAVRRCWNRRLLRLCTALLSANYSRTLWRKQRTTDQPASHLLYEHRLHSHVFTSVSVNPQRASAVAALVCITGDSMHAENCRNSAYLP